MSKVHKTVRLIDGLPYVCQDVGCDDFDRAKQNRELVSSGLFIEGYLIAEGRLARTPFGQRLSDKIPQGELPRLSLDAIKGRMEDIKEKRGEST